MYQAERSYVIVPGIFGRQLTADSALSVDAEEWLSWPAGFVYGASGKAGQSPENLTASFVDKATQLSKSPFASLAAADFDPIVRGKYYANIVIENLKKIPWGDSTVYDVWIGKAER